MITSAQTAPRRFIFPTLGKTERFFFKGGKNNRVKALPSSNVWDPALNALFAESNSLEPGIKNQLAGVRDE